MIYCIGDSFTAGSELPDTVDPERKKYSELAWPTKLGQLINRPVINLGRQGCTNDRIIRRAQDCVWKNDADLIIIAWSRPNRLDLIDDYGVFSVWEGMESHFGSIHRREIIKLLTIIHNDKSDNWHLRKWYRQIILLQAFFKQCNQKYLMVQSHVTPQLNKLYWDKNIDLLEKIDTNFFIGWPFVGFNEWTLGISKMPQKHPTEQGHVVIAERINEAIKNLNLI